MKLIKSLLVITAVILTTACSSVPHSVDSESFAENITNKSYQSLLVLVANEDRNARVGAESRIVEALQQKGVAASASYNIISDMAALEQPNQLAEQMAKQGYDAIVTIRTVDEGYEFGYDDYLANRGFVYLLGGEPGVGTQIGSLISWAGSGQYALLLTLWDIDSQTVVWKATTDSVQTASESESIQSLAQLVEERLGSQGIELK